MAAASVGAPRPRSAPGGSIPGGTCPASLLRGVAARPCCPGSGDLAQPRGDVAPRLCDHVMQGNIRSILTAGEICQRDAVNDPAAHGLLANNREGDCRKPPP